LASPAFAGERENKTKKKKKKLKRIAGNKKKLICVPKKRSKVGGKSRQKENPGRVEISRKRHARKEDWVAPQHQEKEQLL